MTTRVRLEYFDQGDFFDACLPRTGEVLGQYTSTTETADWYLVALDEPISYQRKIAEPFVFRNVETSHLLIRSRWGEPVGKGSPTSVFLLVVEPSQFPLVNPLRIEEYHHVAWGMCHPC